MKRISERGISNAKKGHTAIIEFRPTVYEQDYAVAQAQLEACEKERNTEVRKIFEEIESKFIWYLPSEAGHGRSDYACKPNCLQCLWQALKEKYNG